MLLQAKGCVSEHTLEDCCNYETPTASHPGKFNLGVPTEVSV